MKKLEPLKIKIGGTEVEAPATAHLNLYKYMPNESASKHSQTNLENIFTKGKIRLTCNEEVNDPSDGYPHFDETVTKKELLSYFERLLTNVNSDPITEFQRRSLSSKIPGKLQKRKFLDRNKKMLKEDWLSTAKSQYARMAFTCMTPKWNNRLMWSHYSSSHSGVCVGFRTRPANTSSPLPLAGQFFPMRYSDKRPVWSAKLAAAGDTQSKVIRDVLMQKDDAWAYEEEWRFTFDMADKTPLYKQHDYVNFNVSEISEVIFGIKCTEKTINLVKQLMKASGCSPKLFRMNFKTASYELERKSLN